MPARAWIRKRLEALTPCWKFVPSRRDVAMFDRYFSWGQPAELPRSVVFHTDLAPIAIPGIFIWQSYSLVPLRAYRKWKLRHQNYGDASLDMSHDASNGTCFRTFNTRAPQTGRLQLPPLRLRPGRSFYFLTSMILNSLSLCSLH